MAALSQFEHPHIKQRAKKFIVGSEGWLAATECLEFAPRDELKKLKLAHQGALSRGDLRGGASCGARARFRTPLPGGFGPCSSGITPGPRGARLTAHAAAQGCCDARETQPGAEPGVTAWRVPRRSAERRARPQADVRGNANHPWRAPYRPRNRMRSSEVPVRRLTTRRSALRLPLFFRRHSFVPWLGKTRAQQKRAARMLLCVVIAGLDPAIHAEVRLLRCAARLCLRRFSMDHRVEPGGDEGGNTPRERGCLFFPPPR